MSFINWNETLDLGIAIIDREHRELAKAINDLHFKAKDAASTGELKRLMNGLQVSIEAHFATEERFFAEYGYPGAETHAQLHRDLEKQLTELIDKISRDRLPFTDTVLAFVKDWFLTHTTGSDLVYTLWMRNHGFIHPTTKDLIPRFKR